jgi:hypothetical protein
MNKLRELLAIVFTIAVIYTPGTVRAAPIVFDVGDLPDILSMTISESGVLGEGWAQTTTGGFIPEFAIEPTVAHTVTASFASGRADIFELEITSAPSVLLPFNEVVGVDVIFAPQVGTASSLAPLDKPLTGLSVSPGNVGPVQLFGDLFDFITNQLYDPDRYRLTDVDGAIYDFRQGVGLQSITDGLGQILFFAPGGIIFTPLTGDPLVSTTDQWTLMDRAGNLVEFGDAGANPPINGIPEPSTLALFAFGLLAMRRRIAAWK